MSEITPADIIRWQNDMMEKGLAETYLRMIQNQLTALFTHAARIYDLKNNPCKKVRRMGRADARDLNFWTKAEYDEFISYEEPNSRYYVIFEILFWTGMREGELLALTKDYNLIPRGYASRVKDKRAYAVNLAKVIALTAVPPAHCAIAALFNGVLAASVLVVEMVMALWIGSVIMK